MQCFECGNDTATTERYTRSLRVELAIQPRLEMTFYRICAGDSRPVFGSQWTTQRRNAIGDALPIASYPGPNGQGEKGTQKTGWNSLGVYSSPVQNMSSKAGRELKGCLG